MRDVGPPARQAGRTPHHSRRADGPGAHPSSGGARRSRSPDRTAGGTGASPARADTDHLDGASLTMWSERDAGRPDRQRPPRMPRDQLLIVGERHLRVVPGKYADHYAACRPHRTLNQHPPAARAPIARPAPDGGGGVLGRITVTVLPGDLPGDGSGASHAASQNGWRALRVHRHSAARVSVAGPPGCIYPQIAAGEERAAVDGPDGGRDLRLLTGNTWRLVVQGPGRAAADDLGYQRRARGVRGDPRPVPGIEYLRKPAQALGEMPAWLQVEKYTVISLPWNAFPGHGPADGDLGLGVG